ncbi:MAG: hypothetical protein JWN07_2789 [Hyphomicrobiales bacterium]|nr:hypothetical protein [Hyphomicrobiales bacterium]
MHIVWQTQAGQHTEFETQFLREIVFARTPHTAVFDNGACQFPAAGAVIVYGGFDALPSQALLDYFARSPGHVLVHTGDERLQHVGSHYGAARAVFRSYYDPRRIAQNVFTLPLGFQSGFKNESGVVDCDAKHVAWCFAGQIKSHRKTMIDVFSGVAPGTVHLTRQWSDPNAMRPADMAGLYARSIFAPCPFGFRNPDSYRVMEALEHGCIPVVLSFLGEDYFRFVYGEHPFVIASTWAKAAAEVRGLLANPQRLRARQRETVAWYAMFKENLALDVRDIMAGASRDLLRAPQWRLQQAGMKAATVRRYGLYFGHGLIRRLYRRFAYALN